MTQITSLISRMAAGACLQSLVELIEIDSSLNFELTSLFAHSIDINFTLYLISLQVFVKLCFLIFNYPDLISLPQLNLERDCYDFGSSILYEHFRRPCKFESFFEVQLNSLIGGI